MELWLRLYLFLVGAVVGSFLNVVIARVPKGESIIHPRSRCPRCRSAIAWFDNVPIVSWLLLRARCRRCGLSISPRYPLVELLVGVLAIAIEHRFGLSLVSLGFFAFTAALVALAYIDLDTWLLPHQITWPLLAIGLASPLWNHDLGFVDSAVGAAAGFAFLAAIALFGEKVLKRETMGWGDVWLLAGLGAWLGWRALFPVVMLSSLQGSVVGLAMITAGKRGGAAARDPAEEVAPGAPPVADAPGDPSGAAGPREPSVVAGSREPSPAPAELRAAPSPADLTAAPAPADSAAPADLTAPPADPDLDDWVPPRHAVPFGPFLALAALEFLLLGDWMISSWYSLLGRLWA